MYMIIRVQGEITDMCVFCICTCVYVCEHERKHYRCSYLLKYHAMFCFCLMVKEELNKAISETGNCFLPHVMLVS